MVASLISELVQTHHLEKETPVSNRLLLFASLSQTTSVVLGNKVFSVRSETVGENVLQKNESLIVFVSFHCRYINTTSALRSSYS